MTMYEKFNKLLEKHNVTPYRIHKETGISTATLSDWKNGKSEPKKDKIQKICTFFDVPISYFYEYEPSDDRPTSYEIYAKLLEKHNVKAADVSKATGLPSSLFSEWKRGKSNPKADKLQKIADYFEVPLDYLLSGGIDLNKAEPEFTQRDRRDISKDLNRIISEIENDQDGPLYYEGKPISDTHLALLRNAIEVALEDAKRKNKETYTPKKYKKD